MDRGAPINCTAGAVPVKNEKGKLKLHGNSVVALIIVCCASQTLSRLLPILFFFLS